MSYYKDQQLDLKEGEPHYKAAQYVKEHCLSLIDFDCWAHLENLFGFEIEFQDYQRVNEAVDDDLLDYAKEDVPTLLEILRPKRGNKLYTVSIKDRGDADMDIWTASFSTEEKADEFKAKAEEKLREYGVLETVDVIKDCSELDDDMYLSWIDARYGEEGECY